MNMPCIRCDPEKAERSRAGALYCNKCFKEDMPVEEDLIRNMFALKCSLLEASIDHLVGEKYTSREKIAVFIEMIRKIIKEQENYEGALDQVISVLKEKRE